MKKVLVTGANGQLGQSIRKIHKSYSEYTFIFKNKDILDITNFEEINEFFDLHSINICVNCAAYTAVDKAEDEPGEAFQVNTIGPEVLAKACQRNGALLVHISTDFVFDGESTVPYKETDDPRPISIYGKTKWEGEKRIQANHDQYFIVRTSWVFSEFGSNFVKTMCRLGKEKDELKVVVDQYGCPTYAVDLAHFIMELIRNQEKIQYGIYNFCNTDKTNWYSFAKYIMEQANISCKVQSTPASSYPTKAIRPKYSVLDTTKTITDMGVQIRSWKDGVRDVIGVL